MRLLPVVLPSLLSARDLRQTIVCICYHKGFLRQSDTLRIVFLESIFLENAPDILRI